MSFQKVSGYYWLLMTPAPWPLNNIGFDFQLLR